MYEHFNPLDLAGAGWQHALMLLVALVLGYVLGFTAERGKLTTLEQRLDELETEVDDCQRAKQSAPQASSQAKPSPGVAPVVGVVPVDNAFAATAALADAKTDDLTIIEGIGPDIAALLGRAGIRTFAQLTETPAEQLTGLLRAAGSRYQIHDPGTWPEQARLADQGRWDELKAYQARLDAGRA